MSIKIVSVFGRTDTEPFPDIPAEIRDGREIHPFRNLGQRKLFLPEQTGDFLHGKAVYPVGSRFTAYLFTYFRQIMGRDAKT